MEKNHLGYPWNLAVVRHMFLYVLGHMERTGVNPDHDLKDVFQRPQISDADFDWYREREMDVESMLLGEYDDALALIPKDAYAAEVDRNDRAFEYLKGLQRASGSEEAVKDERSGLYM